MILKKRLAGKYIAIRTAEESDAKFILKLRLDPALNKFMNKTDPSVRKQEEWIRAKQLEANDYHMVIESLGAKRRLGTVAVYNIDYKKKTFEWGRWIISRRAPVLAAIESAKLVYDLAFGRLGLREARFGVNKDNESVMEFHKAYGARVVKKDKGGSYFKFRKDELTRFLKMYKKFTE